MGSGARSEAATNGTPTASLVGLLGEQRAAIIGHLKSEGERTVAQIAGHLGVSEVAARRHLGLLEDDGFLAVRSENRGRGRPVSLYRLTDEARNLFPHRYATVAGDLLDFITDQHGREGLRNFLTWRLDRETESYREVVTAEELHERLEQLAGALSANGYDATVTEDGDGFVLRQEHCAIYDVARDHPELCAYEAATFSQVLGRDVSLSRRETLAGGADACVCCVTPRTTDDD